MLLATLATAMLPSVVNGSINKFTVKRVETPLNEYSTFLLLLHWTHPQQKLKNKITNEIKH